MVPRQVIVRDLSSAFKYYWFAISAISNTSGCIELCGSINFAETIEGRA